MDAVTERPPRHPRPLRWLPVFPVLILGKVEVDIVLILCSVLFPHERLLSMPRNPADKPDLLKVVPLQPLLKQPKTAGRPRKRPMPPLPAFKLNALEQEWYEWIIDTYLSENPDFSDTDRMQLPLVAI